MQVRLSVCYLLIHGHVIITRVTWLYRTPSVRELTPESFQNGYIITKIVCDGIQSCKKSLSSCCWATPQHDSKVSRWRTNTKARQRQTKRDSNIRYRNFPKSFRQRSSLIMVPCSKSSLHGRDMQHEAELQLIHVLKYWEDKRIETMVIEGTYNGRCRRTKTAVSRTSLTTRYILTHG